MYDTPRTIDQLLTMLAETPPRLASLTEGLPPVQLLAPPPEAWSRMATVKGVGKSYQRTVYTNAQWLANHEQEHIKQIGRIANSLRTGL